MNGGISLGFYGIKDIPFGGKTGVIHDHNLAVFEGGVLRDYLHLERVTGSKYDATLEKHVEDLVRRLKLTGGDHPAICSVDHELGKAFISSGGRIRLESLCYSDSLEGLQPAKAFWFGEQLRACTISHELAHIYSCLPFFGDFKEEALLVHYDGGASLSSFSAWICRDGRPRLLTHHNHLRKLTSLFNANALMFALTGTPPTAQHSVPGKLMGLAAYGRYSAELEKWLDSNGYFADIWKSTRPFLEKLKSDWDVGLPAIDNRNKMLQDIAATAHNVFLRESLREIVRHAPGTSGTLYFTGGCALSIKLNSMLLALDQFDEVLIPPCTSDSGLSIGAGAAMAMQQGYSIQTAGPYLNNYGVNVLQSGPDPEIIREIAARLSNGAIIGICNGPGEVGPRALGNRSILCRADSPELARKVSMECKGREWYRPLAPVMLAPQATRATGIPDFPASAAFMLFDFAVLEEFRPNLIGAVHADGTARIQVISQRSQNPFLHDLLMYLHREHDIQALINTSFNEGGKPMVQTGNDAKRAARALQLDGLVIDGKLCDF